MAQIEASALLHVLGGSSKEPPGKYSGRTILYANVSDEKLVIGFDDGVSIEVFDDGQQTDEVRYMSTDDDVSSLIGHQLVHIVSKDGPDSKDEDEVHETCFIEIATSGGFITLTNHNEHNGHYGGFTLTINEV